jgi:hypothetical protein
MDVYVPALDHLLGLLRCLRHGRSTSAPSSRSAARRCSW